MSGPDGEYCWDCVYNQCGRCNKYAPLPILIDCSNYQEVECRFPSHPSCGWCGEFKKKGKES